MSDEETSQGVYGDKNAPPVLRRFDEDPPAQPTSADQMMQYMASILEQNTKIMAQLLANQITSPVQPQNISTPVTEIQVKPDVSVSIPVFNGEEDEIMASEWLGEFNRIAELSRWTERDKLTVASMKMIASAKDWHRTEGVKCTNWNLWESAFKEAFARVPDVPELWQQMVARKQGKDEIVTKYIREKAKLCDRLKLSSKDTMGLIIKGLWSRGLSYAMRDKAHKTVNELIRDIAEYEAFGKERDQWFGREKSKTGNPQPEKRPEGNPLRRWGTGSPKEESKNKHVSSVEKNEKVRCYNCQMTGHYASNCTNPRKNRTCNRCGAEGHFKKDCPMNSTEKSTLYSSAGCTPTSQKVLRSMTMSEVDDQTGVPAFIDTGSHSSFMKISLAAKLRKDFEPPATAEIIKVFGGGREHPMGRVRATVTVDDVSVPDLMLYVVRDEAYEGPALLLGRSFIDQPSITMVRRNGVTRFLTKEQAEPFLNWNLEPEMNRVSLRACEDVQIEPGLIAWIDVISSNRETGLVKWESPPEHEHDVLYQLVEGKTVLPVMNYSDQAWTVKQNQVIQRVRPVPEAVSKISEGLTSMINMDPEEKKLRVMTETPTELKYFGEDKDSIFMTEGPDNALTPITVDQIEMGEHESTEMRQEFCKFLNKYRQAFSFTMKELGCTDLVVMKIREVEGSKPVCRAPYPMSQAQRVALRKIIKEMLEAGLIRESESEYSSPVLMVKKKQPGEYRMVVDYRRLNLQTVKDKHPIARMDDVLEKLAGYELYTTLDMAHGYFQIPLEENSVPKAAFTTLEGHYEPLRMFFGLTNGPPVYQRMVARMLSDIPWGVVGSFFDDLAIPARDWEDMCKRLELVFRAIIKARLTLRLSKCSFGKKEVEFLGFIISKDGIKPGPKKLEAISNMNPPTNVHGIRRFLGLMSFFRRFIPRFAQIAAPLTDELRHKEGGVPPKEIAWSEKHQLAFDELRGKLLSAPVLRQFDPTKQTELHTDASSQGLAGMLLQRATEDSKWQLVFCASRRTSEVESRYHSSRLELMAISWCVDKFRSLLLGIHFTIVTDCAAIVYINTQKSVLPQVARWVDKLQEYDFELKYRPGTKMAHVDCLSRAAVGEASSDDDDSICEPVPGMMSQVLYTVDMEDKILLIQRQDLGIMKLLTVLQKKASDRTREEKAQVSKYKLKNGLLYREFSEKCGTRLLFVIPRTLRKYVTVKNHDFGGHFATDKTVEKILRHYWFPKLRSYVKQHIGQCIECLFHKTPGGKRPGGLNPIDPGKRPFEIVHLDHLGPFITSQKKNSYVLVLVDNFTKYIVLQAYPSTRSSLVLKFLTQFVDQYGLPSRVITDRGTCFTSKEFDEFCAVNGIKHTLTSTQRAQANGQVERINRVLIPAIASHLEWKSHKDWDVHLPRIAREINDTIHKSTGCTPFELLYGYNPRYQHDYLEQYVDTGTEHQSIEERRDIAREAILKGKGDQKRRYDRKRCPAIAYEVGDVIVVRRQPVPTGMPTKTQAKYHGPMTIVKVLPADTYEIASLRGSARSSYTTTAHADQIKLFKLVHEDGSEISDSNDEIESEEEEMDKIPTFVSDPSAKRLKNIEPELVVPSPVQGEPDDHQHF